MVFSIEERGKAKFQRIHRIFTLWEGPAYDLGSVTIHCELYELLKGKSEECKYPKKTKCERCPVYNGFAGNERYRLEMRKLNLIEDG